MNYKITTVFFHCQVQYLKFSNFEHIIINFCIRLDKIYKMRQTGAYFKMKMPERYVWNRWEGGSCHRQRSAGILGRTIHYKDSWVRFTQSKSYWINFCFCITFWWFDFFSLDKGPNTRGSTIYNILDQMSVKVWCRCLMCIWVVHPPLCSTDMVTRETFHKIERSN